MMITPLFVSALYLCPVPEQMHRALQLCAKAGSAAGCPPLDRNCCMLGGENVLRSGLAVSWLR